MYVCRVYACVLRTHAYVYAVCCMRIVYDSIVGVYAHVKCQKDVHRKRKHTFTKTRSVIVFGKCVGRHLLSVYGSTELHYFPELQRNTVNDLNWDTAKLSQSTRLGLKR